MNFTIVSADCGALKIMLFVFVPPEDTVGVIGLIMLFVRIPPEETVGVIELIMIFVGLIKYLHIYIGGSSNQ